MGMDGGNGRLDGARAVAADIDAATLDAARFELESWVCRDDEVFLKYRARP